MSILYIEDKLKEREKKERIIKALSDIGLDPEDLPDLINKEDTMRDYQEWVKERFFTEYELKESKVITPNFGKDPESE